MGSRDNAPMAKREYHIHWRYAAKLELPRLSVVEADNEDAAIAQIMSNHLDPDSHNRNKIEILDVK